ncbi:Butyrophilin subfamily 1 member A1 [Larimichthys crocea]|uniref:Uncharacterized protein n=1 Tax=Larimichthys crocea TaxID=215358 RepID=A0ACD3Q4M0_LARCR|nr:Butyrophilin subfamily 1 member A1 [Larimichthys crocea]
MTLVFFYLDYSATFCYFPVKMIHLTDELNFSVFRALLPHHSVIVLLLLQSSAGAVSSPFIVSVNRTSSRLVLQCESKGWYPEPEVFWLDGEGNLLSAGPTETVRGPDDLYTVSRRLTVEKSDTITCRVQQKDINQTRETHICISAEDVEIPTCFHWIIICVIFSIFVTTLNILYNRFRTN